MATQGTIPFKNLKIEIGDGATPTEAFSAPCGLATKTFNLAVGNSETNLLDCSDEDVITWVQRAPTVKSATIGGSGRLPLTSLTKWMGVHDDGVANFKITAVGFGSWVGPCILSSFELAADKFADASTVTYTVSLDSAGPLVFTPAA